MLWETPRILIVLPQEIDCKNILCYKKISKIIITIVGAKITWNETRHKHTQKSTLKIYMIGFCLTSIGNNKEKFMLHSVLYTF